MFAAGVASMVLFQLVVNVGMVIGIMPITGIPLPFVTHGGASLVSIAVGLGMLQSINIRQPARNGDVAPAPRPDQPEPATGSDASAAAPNGSAWALGTSRPIVVAWTRSVNSTTPKTTSWSRARCGRSGGRANAIATATAPRRPDQKMTSSHGRGIGPPNPGMLGTRDARPSRPYVTIARPMRIADDAQPDRPGRPEQLGRRDHEADEQEHDRGEQVGEELPDRVDGIGAGGAEHAARARRCRARSPR